MSKKSNLKPLFVRIDEKLYEALKKLVIKKYGENYWGGLRAIVEEALRLYIASHSNDQISLDLSNVKPNNPPPKVHTVYLQVKKFLREQGFLKEVRYGDLARAIAYIRGSDKRTIRKWIMLFLAYKCIKHLGGVVYELL